MTKEEKQKAIAALKKSTPVMAVTSEEFEDYIRTLNQIIDWLEQPETVTEFADRCRECGAKYGKLLKEAESKSNTSELKPCPFCGTEVEMRKVPLYGYPGCFEFEVKCPKCGCAIDFTHNDTVYRSEEEAIANDIKAWNERYVHWFERAKESEENQNDSKRLARSIE